MARAARIPLRQRLLSVLVCLHVLAPALAAVVDAWRLDGRAAAQEPTPLAPHRN